MENNLKVGGGVNIRTETLTVRQASATSYSGSFTITSTLPTVLGFSNVQFRGMRGGEGRVDNVDLTLNGNVLTVYWYIGTTSSDRIRPQCTVTFIGY